MDFNKTEFEAACLGTIERVRELLHHEPEWKERYFQYAHQIHKNIDLIRKRKETFREWKPLHLYMTVGQAKSQMNYRLRFLGQDVAKLSIGEKGNFISTDEFDATNKQYFDCHLELKNRKWVSGDAQEFRRYFSERPKRIDSAGTKNEEHRVESVLLTEFLKKKGQNKRLHHIQPVTMAGVARFQMPTPLCASNMGKLSYEMGKGKGGGIDIISRIGKSPTKLCIMEVKDQNNSKEPPAKVIQQGLAYATFILELLRSEGGPNWWKLFGFQGSLPEKPEIFVASVMPFGDNNDKTFANTVIKTDQGNFHLHYLYFDEKDNKINDILTSLPQCLMNPLMPMEP
jgi:hypothetical protein